jgi:hypothetical protein
MSAALLSSSRPRCGYKFKLNLQCLEEKAREQFCCAEVWNQPSKELGDIGNEAEAAIASRTINGEIPAVKREDSVDGFAIGQMNKRGIGELRPHGFVFL